MANVASVSIAMLAQGSVHRPGGPVSHISIHIQLTLPVGAPPSEELRKVIFRERSEELLIPLHLKFPSGDWQEIRRNSRAAMGKRPGEGKRGVEPSERVLPSRLMSRRPHGCRSSPELKRAIQVQNTKTLICNLSQGKINGAHYVSGHEFVN